MTDWLIEIGKIFWFILTAFYNFVLWIKTTITPIVGEPASYLFLILTIGVPILILLVYFSSVAVSQTYSVMEVFWGWLWKFVVLAIIVFVILYLLK